MLSDESICNSKRFVEIGCGSGAICISLLKQLPSVSVVVSSAYTLILRYDQLTELSFVCTAV